MSGKLILSQVAVGSHYMDIQKRHDCPLAAAMTRQKYINEMSFGFGVFSRITVYIKKRRLSIHNLYFHGF
jgi:hypothetical protein